MSDVSPEWAEYFADPPTGPEHPTQAELEALAGILEMPFVDYDAYQIIAAYRRGVAGRPSTSPEARDVRRP